jgi:CDP-paratose 2-epimerase
MAFPSIVLLLTLWHMKILVTGSSGLIGSEAVIYFDREGHKVVGVDNNLRREFFGLPGDTLWNLERIKKTARCFRHLDMDIRDRQKMLDLFKQGAIRHDHSLRRTTFA